MKKLLFILVMMISVSVMAQEGCYERNRAKGIEFYNRGDKENAERSFRQAQNCADKPANNDIDEWLAKIGGDLRLSHESIEFSPEGGTVEVIVYGADSKIELSGMPKWCSCEKVLDKNDLTLIFTATPNNSDYSRRSTVTIISPRHEVSLVLSQTPLVVIAGSETKTESSKPFRFELKGGINMPSFSVKSSNVLSSVMDYCQTGIEGLQNNETPKYESQLGFDIEADFDIKVAKNMYIGVGAGYSSYTFKNAFSSKEEVVYTQYFEDYFKISIFDYKYNETYKLSYLNIPIMFKYRNQFSKVCAFDVQTGFNIGIGIAGKLSVDGNIYTDILYSDEDDTYYNNSNVSGTVDLFNNRYDITQQYTTGSSPKYSYKGSMVASPYNKLNCQWVVGASFYVSVVKIGFQYNLGIANIANKTYWESGNRVGGLLISGDPLKSSESIKGYKQRLSSLSVSLGVSF